MIVPDTSTKGPLHLYEGTDTSPNGFKWPRPIAKVLAGISFADPETYQECRDCGYLLDDPYYWWQEVKTRCSSCSAIRWYARYIQDLFARHRSDRGLPPPHCLCDMPIADCEIFCENHLGGAIRQATKVRTPRRDAKGHQAGAPRLRQKDERQGRLF